ncbi:MAG: ABC transporter ATP-binding protein [Thiohalomonadales bacterium]
MTSLIDVKSIECRYSQQSIVRDLSFHVNPGEIACLLGQSGCGKTTVLRAIAGLEPIHNGEIHYNHKVISRAGYNLAPELRGFGMVFQDYALFPHMTIAENIGFGIRNISLVDKQARIKQLLNVVDMSEFSSRYAHELSGGQQQRVALARALAAKPKLILMDEPFSNLDVELREQLGQAVKEILQQHGATAILVTHHQDEAFAMGDHIGIMNNGQILQWDTPFNVYHEPNDFFVADFIGQGMFVDATVLSPDSLDTEFGIIKGDRAYPWPKGTKVKVLFRPDDVVADHDSQLLGEIVHKAFKGAEILYTLKLSTGSTLLSLFPSHLDHSIGEKIAIRLDLQHLVAFPTDAVINATSVTQTGKCAD